MARRHIYLLLVVLALIPLGLLGVPDSPEKETKLATSELRPNGAPSHLDGDPAIVDAPSGTGLKFEAENDAVMWPFVNRSAQFNNQATVQTRVNLSEHGGTITFGPQWNYWLRTTQGGNLQAVFTTSEDRAVKLYTSHQVPINDWVRLTATYNEGSNRARVYANGSLLLEKEVSEPLKSASDEVDPSFYLGKFPHQNHMIGAVDYMRVYNRSLSRQQVSSGAPDTVGTQPVINATFDNIFNSDASANVSVQGEPELNSSRRLSTRFWATSGFSRPVSFDGDDVVEVNGIFENGDWRDGGTISMRVRPTSHGQTITHTPSGNFWVRTNQGGKVQGVFYDREGEVIRLYSGKRLQLGVEYDITAVYDRERGEARMYVDGVEIENNTKVNKSMAPLEGPLYVGRWGGHDNYYNGSILSLKVSDEVKSPTEIRTSVLSVPQWAATTGGKLVITVALIILGYSMGQVFTDEI